MHRINLGVWQLCKYLSDLNKMAARESRSQGNVNFNYKLYFHISSHCLCDEAFLLLF